MRNVFLPKRKLNLVFVDDDYCHIILLGLRSFKLSDKKWGTKEVPIWMRGTIKRRGIYFLDSMGAPKKEVSQFKVK